MTDSGAKNRVRLWLRSERSLGLTSLPVPVAGLAEAQSAASPPPPTRPVARIADPALPVGNPRRPASPAPSPPPAAPVGLTPLQSPFTAPLLSTADKKLRLAAMDRDEVSACTKCPLHRTRKHTVFGEGDVDAQIFFIGEGPGETEDDTGRPFVGRAGQLLDKMIAGMGLQRQQVFIANIVKCRPPNNRVPAPDEVATCTPYLQRQLEIVRPKVIVTLGLPATKYMLQSALTMGRLRGQWHSWRGIKLMPTYHPSYVLRVYTQETRQAVWSDLQKVMAELKLPPPKKGG